MKGCSTSLIIIEMKIKTFYFSPFRWIKFKRMIISVANKDVKEQEFFIYCWKGKSSDPCKVIWI